MPYHDRFAYTDKRCYVKTHEQMGKDADRGKRPLSNSEATRW